MPSSADRTADPWQSHAARALLADLADRGVSVTVRAGLLDVRPASRLSDADVAQLRAYKPDLIVLALVCDERTLDRLLNLRRGAPIIPEAPVPSRCCFCGEPLPRGSGLSRCGWCALAGRLYAGAPLTHDVLGLFDTAIVGPYAPANTPRTLHLDGAA